MSEWKECKLGEIIEIVCGGTPKTSMTEYWNGDIPWLSVVDFNTGNKYVNTTEKTITKKGLDNSSTKLLKTGDIIISARGTVGAIAVLKKSMAFNQSCYGIRSVPEVSNQDFLYYLSKDSIHRFQQIAHGGVFDTITKDTFNAIDILLPPLPEQKAIASVLSSLDDKIDLLHRQNKTLEAMAETLFRQWFIEESQDDWEWIELKEIVSVIDNRGKTPPHISEKTFYPLIEVNALGKENRLVDYSAIKKYVYKDIFDNWFRDSLIKYDLLISTVGSIGVMSMFIIEKGNIAQNVIGLHTDNISPFYIYQFLKYKQAEILQLDIGGVQPSIKVPHLLSILILLPNSQRVYDFDKQVLEYVKKMENNYKQILVLEKLRDTLLPKLMSGEVRMETN